MFNSPYTSITSFILHSAQRAKSERGDDKDPHFYLGKAQRHALNAEAKMLCAAFRVKGGVDRHTSVGGFRVFDVAEDWHFSIGFDLDMPDQDTDKQGGKQYVGYDPGVEPPHGKQWMIVNVNTCLPQTLDGAVIVYDSEDEARDHANFLKGAWEVVPWRGDYIPATSGLVSAPPSEVTVSKTEAKD